MGLESLNPQPDEFRWHYTYDDLSRVNSACAQWNATTSACEGDAWTYTYDGAGNLLRFDQWSGGAITTTRFVYNGANQIECIDADASGVCDGTEFVYQYDAYGNLLDDGSSQYTYDAALRLKTVTKDGMTTSYTYNGDGDRVSQTVGTTTTTYVLDIATPLTMVLAETTGTDTIRYLHGLDLVAQSDGVSIEYFAYDGLGSVRQVLDAAGLPLMAQTFDPYGNPYSYAGPTESVTSFGYSGEQTDSNGLVFLRARYYAPSMGRFMQMDPSRQERNPYLYANDNPINNVDPTGLQSEPTCSSGYEWYCLLMSILAPGQPAAPPTGPLTYPGNPGDPYLNPPQYPQWPVANPGTQPLNPVPTTPMLPWYTALPGTLGGWFSACSSVLLGLWAFTPTPVPVPITPVEPLPDQNDDPRPDNKICDPATDPNCKNDKVILFHYGTLSKIEYINTSQTIPVSDESINPQRARYGTGVYFTDIVPGSLSKAQIARQLYGNPFPSTQKSVEAWVAIDLTGLTVLPERIYVFRVPITTPLNVAGRILGTGTTPEEAIGLGLP